jgi:hypothetical protein
MTGNKQAAHGVCSEVRMPLHIVLQPVLISLLFSICGSAQQTKQRMFVLVHLPSYELIPHQRLRFLAGITEAQIRKKPIEIRLETNARGRVSIPMNPRWRWFQLWVDGPGPCPDNPYKRFISHSSVLFDEGVVASNTYCHNTLERLEPDSPYMPQ